MAKALRFLGLVWCGLAALVILAGYASTVYFKGFGRLLEILSPFNIWNYITVVLTLAPGLLCLMGADKLDERRRR